MDWLCYWLHYDDQTNLSLEFILVVFLQTAAFGHIAQL